MIREPYLVATCNNQPSYWAKRGNMPALRTALWDREGWRRRLPGSNPQADSGKRENMKFAIALKSG